MNIYIYIYFFKDIQMAHRHMKMCSAELIIREMPINTTITSCLLQWSSSNKTRYHKYWHGYEQKRILVYCCYKGIFVVLLLKTIWSYLKNIKSGNYHMIQWFHSGYTYPKEMKTVYQRDISSMFTASLFTKAKLLKWLKCPPTNEWIKKV